MQQENPEGKGIPFTRNGEIEALIARAVHASIGKALSPIQQHVSNIEERMHQNEIRITEQQNAVETIGGAQRRNLQGNPRANATVHSKR